MRHYLQSGRGSFPQFITRLGQRQTPGLWRRVEKTLLAPRLGFASQKADLRFKNESPRIHYQTERHYWRRNLRGLRLQSNDRLPTMFDDLIKTLTTLKLLLEGTGDERSKFHRRLRLAERNTL